MGLIFLAIGQALLFAYIGVLVIVGVATTAISDKKPMPTSTPTPTSSFQNGGIR